MVKSGDIYRRKSSSLLLSPADMPTTEFHYQVIHSLLRVVRRGLECKQLVDDAIDKCATHVNIRQQIEFWRAKADSSSDNAQDRQLAIKKGLNCLHRYFMLIAF